MLKEILESSGNLGYVYINKIGGKYISNRIYEIEEWVSDELPDFDGDILADIIFNMDERIYDDLVKKKMIKDGYGAISIGLKYVNYEYKKGYKFEVDYVNIFNEEGDWIDGTIEDAKKYIDFIENCKEIELNIDDDWTWEWIIEYSPKALKCFPQVPMNS